MSQEKTTLEVIAPTVDEAIENGLNQLGIPREAVEVEVLDPGSRGIFGLGGRQARVRLTLSMPDSVPVATAEPVQQRPVVETRKVEPVQTARVEKAPAVSQPVAELEPDDEKPLEVAAEVVRDLLQRMKVDASVTTEYILPEDSKDQRMILVEIQGDDLSILIGRRSETLNALQYVSSLIIGKQLDRWVPLMIDVQGYRSRRERQLRQLARRMAEQCVHTGRRQVLEPMPANERRLIHLELKDHPKVTTESIGEEPSRKVTICLKK